VVNLENHDIEDDLCLIFPREMKFQSQIAFKGGENLNLILILHQYVLGCLNPCKIEERKITWRSNYMKMKLSKIFALLIITVMIVTPVAAQPTNRVDSSRATDDIPEFQPVTDVQEVGNLNARVVGEVKGATEPAVYLVMLSDPPLANYAGGIADLKATNPAARGETKLDAESEDSLRYVSYLDEQRAEAITRINRSIGRELDIAYEYVAAMNGFAAEMTPAEAAQVATLPGVLLVQKDREFELQTDAGPAWIGAPGVWDGSETGGTATFGEGVIVGVIDTGIDPWNPSFADIGGDGYDHDNPWGSGNYVGVCDSGDPSYDPTFPCNDKLIGAWGYATVNGGDPRDSDGHGSHTSSTAAGNFVYNTVITTTAVFTADISGVAPHANIVMYAACCTGAALSAARDQVILDGVDVVNYSIGSTAPTGDPWGDTFALQWLAVRNAGIFVATSAGNAGPDDETMGSPGDVPWMTTIGASSHNRTFLNTLTADDGVNPPIDLNGESMTGALLTPVEIVFSSAYTLSGTIDPEDARLCADGVFPPGTFSGEIVVCERGIYGRVAKGQTVLDGGAGGYILAQPDEIGGGPGSLASDPHVLPAVHIDYYTYQNLLAYVNAAPGPVMGTISGSTRAVGDQYADIMASFSSRGANGSPKLLDIVKPNVTAPGRAIWAAYHQGPGGDGDYTYNVIQGTSMASPHVAGAGALMVALHPDWTPAQIESALMTTAETGVLNDDGMTPATPFAQGSGRVDLTNAGKAGLVLDITDAEFTAADPATGGDPKTLNLASLGNSQCLAECQWTRVVSSTQSSSVEWTAVITAPAGMTVSVTPSNFVLGAFAEQTITVTADVTGLPFDAWAFGEFTLEPADMTIPAAHFPVAVKPTAGVVPGSVEFETRRNAGSVVVKDLESLAITDLTIENFGLVAGLMTTELLDQDPTNGDPYDTITGTFFVTTTVMADAVSLIAETFDSSAPDMDLFVGTGDTPGAGTQVCSSTTPTAVEFCKVDNPTPGTYWVLVQNWDASATPPDTVTLSVAVVPGSDSGNMMVTGPASVPAATPYDLQLFWDVPSMMEGDRYYGAFSVGSDPGNPGNIATIPVYIHRVADDVVKTANTDLAVPGDTITYTISVQPNITAEDLAYMITDTLPAGVTFVPGSLVASTGTAGFSDGVISWTLDVPLPTYDYVMTTSDADPWCNTGFGDGSYINLQDYGINANSAISGDTDAWTAFSTANPVNFYGVEYGNVGFTDDGFAIFDPVANYGGSPWNPQTLPDPDIPNNLIAGFWQDLEIFYDAGLNHGVSLATAGPDLRVIEYDDIQYWGGSTETWDFEFVIYSRDDTPGYYEFIVAYDNLSEVTGPLTVGVENLDGTQSVTLVNNADATGVISDGFMVCFDYQAFGADVETLTYAVTVDAGTLGNTVTNAAEHQTDNPGSKVAITSYDVAIGYTRLLPLIFK